MSAENRNALNLGRAEGAQSDDSGQKSHRKYKSFSELTQQEKVNFCSELLQCISRQRPTYEDWIRVISAVGNELPEHEALNLLLTYIPDEKPNETLGKLRKRLKSVTIGTLIYYANKAGWTPKSSGKQHYYSTPRTPRPKPQPQQQKVSFSDADKTLLYRIIYEDPWMQDVFDEMTNGFCSAAEIHANLCKFYPDRASFRKERVFPMAYNPLVQNKTPKDGDFNNLTYGYKNALLSLDEIANKFPRLLQNLTLCSGK